MAAPKYYEYNGESHKLNEWAEITGINKKTLAGRLRKGWSLDDVLSTPLDTIYSHPGNKREEYEYNGEMYTLARLEKEYGVSHKTIRARLNKGWTIGRTLTEPVRDCTRKSRSVIDYENEASEVVRCGEHNGAKLFCTMAKNGKMPVGCIKRECPHCGFEAHEMERRRKLPLVKGKGVLWHKCVGRAADHDGRGER